MTEIAELQRLANLARRSLEPGLPRGATWAPNGAGACLHACLVLAVLIKRFGRGVVSIRGGSVGTGARDVLGQWQGHYWVVVRTPDSSEFVVDITADQFGYEPVVVMPVGAASDRYRNGPQCEVDEAFAELVNELNCRDMVTVC